MLKPKILFIANNNIGTSLSGGDTIFCQLLFHWSKHSATTILACQEAINILPRQISSTIIQTDVTNLHSQNTILNLFLHYLRRIFRAFVTINKNCQFLLCHHIVYSVSDFLPDLLPALYLKIKKPQLKWVAGYYLFAPPPWKKNTPYHGRLRLKGLIYWFIQKLTLSLVNRYADFILVTSSPDAKRFYHQKQVVIIQGGVDLQKIQKYLQCHPPIALDQRKYSACFIGRLHPQKGVLELIDIWKIVVSSHPQAKLALIGDGELESKLRHKICQLRLQNHIHLFGFRNGPSKYSIFRQSKIVVHPAIYDSGGMAAAEAMAFGLPGVSFDLESLKSYYPRGMIKTPCFDLDSFAQNIIKLLTNGKLYRQATSQALGLISSQWNWSQKSANLFRLVLHSPKCRSCGSSSTTPTFSSDNQHGRLTLSSENFTVYFCRHCHTYFLHNVEEEKNYHSKYYLKNYYPGSSPSRDILNSFGFGLKKSLLKKHLDFSKPISILDIGCGQGEFLRCLPDKFLKYGVELDGKAARIASHHNAKIFTGDINTFDFDPLRFDCISMWQVLEHLPNPLVTLRKIHRLLKPNGILIFTTPNSRCLGFKYGQKHYFHLDSPRHLFIPCKKGLVCLLTRSGFSRYEFNYPFYDYPLDLFWSLRYSFIKYLVYPVYPLIKLISQETLLTIAFK